jgi:enoyl-CoA hydratase/carnithine racemase
MSDGSDSVVLSVDGAVATLQINRPENRNAMTLDVLTEFRTRVGEVGESRDVRVLIVTGAGKFFCSGADFRASADLMTQSGLDGQAGYRESAKKIYGAFLCLRELEIPIIAAMNGHAVGGGLGLALMCDVRLASETAKIAANFVRLGLHPGMGITYSLPRLVGPERAAELLFTGRTFSGRQAHEYGLVSSAMPADEVLDTARAMAQQMAEAAPYALRLTKRSLQDCASADLPATIEREAYAQALCMQMDDAKEGIAALLQKRPPKFKGR